MSKKVDDPPLLADRKRCWAAKDAYWSCLDSHRGDESKCDRSEFEKNCPKVWVGHFDRKYRFEKAPLFEEESISSTSGNSSGKN